VGRSSGIWDLTCDDYDNVYDLTRLGSVVYRLRLDDACCACIVVNSNSRICGRRPD